MLCSTAFVACDKQTTPEALDVQVPPTKSEDYFEALRQYKNSKHQLCFGWFGNWTATGSAMSTRLDNVPDSVDIISIWGNTYNLTPEMKADMAYVQQKKGTKVIFTIFAHTVPEMFIAEDGTIDYASYAKSLMILLSNTIMMVSTLIMNLTMAEAVHYATKIIWKYLSMKWANM